MSFCPIFGISGFTPKFMESKYNEKKANICDYLYSLGLNMLEIPYTDLNKLTKKDRNELLFKKKEFSIRISCELYQKIDINNIDKYKRFLEKAIDIDCKYILIPLNGFKQGYNIDLVVDFIKRIREITPSDITLYPEISGKNDTIGSLEDIIYICSKVKNTYPCLDLGLLHGREYGSLVDYRKINRVFTIVESFLGRDSLKNCYCKVYPVSYNYNGFLDSKLFGEQYYGQMNLFNQSTEYLPKASEYITSILKKDITPITVSKTDHNVELGAIELRDLYFIKSN